ncbi:hypothetical protein PPMP20_29645 [Paraburkholderia phymatum]|uniref:Uncharacterized protein n=1 Tax=Paraburkholderia phymatum (strain DSM 17167 / CIP 108236 / LMG 21445 / STM815) TaxID=391038 RepID=B2JRU1_PARP8|nr:hypothetical protein [Paraburkholderia phymatum]ACC73860.1 hypothetical protein Bphy_4751 [Paraburkholderia phymatum STM815]
MAPYPLVQFFRDLTLTLQIASDFCCQHSASHPGRLEDGQRTELLCHLVVEQLLSRAGTGKWLELGRVVECIQRWTQTKGLAPDWMEGARLGELSGPLASDLWQIRHLRSTTRISSLRDLQGMPDSGSPFVQRMFAVCEARLLAHGMVAARTVRT